MAGTLLLVNHVQEGFIDSNNPADVALRQQILDYVEELRPYVNEVAWSYATKFKANGLPFNLAKERPSTYQPYDLTLENEDGHGLDSNFLKRVFDTQADHVILVGVFFEACSASTAKTLKDSLGIKVSVPMDITNPPERGFEKFYHDMAAELKAKGIDVKSSSAELKDALIKETRTFFTGLDSLENKATPDLENNPIPDTLS